MALAEMTGREMCEYICRWLKEKHGSGVDPDAIWNISSTGELFPVYELFHQAQREMGDAVCTCGTEDPVAGQICVKCNRIYTPHGWYDLDALPKED